jgi:hypothetical protein
MRMWPAYRVEDVLRMPWYQFRLFLRVGSGDGTGYRRPLDPMEEADNILTDMARWREKHGKTALPRHGTSL